MFCKVPVSVDWITPSNMPFHNGVSLGSIQTRCYCRSSSGLSRRHTYGSI